MDFHKWKSYFYYAKKEHTTMRKFKSKEELEAERQEIIRYMPGAQQQLPIDKFILIYGRQSTVHQYVNNKESAQQQAIDLLDHALILGWPDTKRQLFIENQLKDGTIKAKDYTQKHIRGTMVKNRDRKAMRGEFSGHAVPTGFLLDSEHLYYVPNPYFAPVMARLLKRFRELNGNFAQFRREIVGKPIFPDVPEDIIPRVGRIQLTKVPGGYTIKSYDGLRVMLTNVALIGHIAYKGQIVKRNAHEAIVDEGDFWYCFNRLSPTDTDGVPFERLQKVKRYSNTESGALLQGTRDNGQAVITSPLAAVYVNPHTTRKGFTYVYIIRDNARVTINKDVACMNVAILDNIFETRFIERLDNYRDMQQPTEPIDGYVNVWQAIGAQIRKRAQREGIPIEQSPYDALHKIDQEKPISLASIPELMAEATQTIARLQREYTVTFDLMSDAELRENRETRLKLAHDIEEMERKQQSATVTEEDKNDVDALLADAKNVWSTYTLERKRRLIRLVTTAIELSVLADGWLVLSIKWSPYLGYKAIDTAFIWQQGGAGKVWTDQENDFLKMSYASADRADILKALPNRSWTSISGHAYTLGLHRKAASPFPNL